MNQRCPACNGTQNKVLETRANGTRRRHLCYCGEKFTSYADGHAVLAPARGRNPRGLASLQATKVGRKPDAATLDRLAQGRALRRKKGKE